MPIAAVTSKGQITIPKEIRDALHLHPGVRVDFVREKDGRVLFRPATRSLLDFSGMLRHAGRPVSVEEMKEAVRRRAAERDARTRR